MDLFDKTVSCGEAAVPFARPVLGCQNEVTKCCTYLRSLFRSESSFIHTSISH